MLHSDVVYRIVQMTGFIVYSACGVGAGRVIKNTKGYSIVVLISVLLNVCGDVFAYLRNGTNHLASEWPYLTMMAACAITVFLNSSNSSGNSQNKKQT